MTNEKKPMVESTETTYKTGVYAKSADSQSVMERAKELCQHWKNRGDDRKYVEKVEETIYSMCKKSSTASKAFNEFLESRR